MKIGFTAKGKEWDSAIDPRFGRAEYLLVYDDEKDELSSYDNTGMSEQAHGVGPGTASKLFEMGAEVLITGNGPGENAAEILRKAKIEIYTGAGELSVRKAYENYQTNVLIKF